MRTIEMDHSQTRNGFIDAETGTRMLICIHVSRWSGVLTLLLSSTGFSNIINSTRIGLAYWRHWELWDIETRKNNNKKK